MKSSLLDHDTKKRAEPPARRNSPSYFVEDDLPLNEAVCGHLSEGLSPEQVQKDKVDLMLSTVSSMYYRPKYKYQYEKGENRFMEAETDDSFDWPTIATLLSPMRRTDVLDNWNPREISLFEAGITALGKDFYAIQKLIKTKSTNEVVDFYYYWKQSSHGMMWKEFGKPCSTVNDNKKEQWGLIAEKMKFLRDKRIKHKSNQRPFNVDDGPPPSNIVAKTQKMAKPDTEWEDLARNARRSRRRTRGGASIIPGALQSPSPRRASSRTLRGAAGNNIANSSNGTNASPLLDRLLSSSSSSSSPTKESLKRKRSEEDTTPSANEGDPAPSSQPSPSKAGSSSSKT